MEDPGPVRMTWPALKTSEKPCTLGGMRAKSVHSKYCSWQTFCKNGGRLLRETLRALSKKQKMPNIKPILAPRICVSISVHLVGRDDISNQAPAFEPPDFLQGRKLLAMASARGHVGREALARSAEGIQCQDHRQPLRPIEWWRNRMLYLDNTRPMAVNT